MVDSCMRAVAGGFLYPVMPGLLVCLPLPQLLVLYLPYLRGAVVLRAS